MNQQDAEQRKRIGKSPKPRSRMAPEISEKTAACGQLDGMITDMVLDPDQQRENQGEAKEQDIDPVPFQKMDSGVSQNCIFSKRNIRLG